MPTHRAFQHLLFCAALLFGLLLLTPLMASAGFELDGMACLDCHAELSEKKVIHSIIADSDSCTMCHAQDNPDLHGFDPFAANIGEGVCSMCHGEFPGSGELHYPVADGDCLTCHNPHQSDLAALLTRPQGELCFDCHAPFDSKQKAHAPVASGSCSDCHDPHRADQPSLLRAVEPELCFQCHGPFDASGSSHMPVEFGECSSCHLPHVAAEPKLLSAPQKELCLQCHAEFSGALIHGPIKEGNCAGCHDPHGAAQLNLLKATEPDLCFSCHGRRLNAADGRPLVPIQPLFEGEQQLKHFPFEDGRCSDCHLPHAGEHARLLNDAYPSGIYAAYSEEAYAFCFNCHDSGAFEDLRSTSATNFRNGELNLHYRHTNRDKGRTCNACHSGHASVQPSLVRERFSFGKNLLGQRFTATAGGGTCATACHIEVSYDRDTPVNNRLRTTPWE